MGVPNRTVCDFCGSGDLYFFCAPVPLDHCINTQTDHSHLSINLSRSQFVMKHDAIRNSARMHPLHYSVTSQAKAVLPEHDEGNANGRPSSFADVG